MATGQRRSLIALGISLAVIVVAAVVAAFVFLGEGAQDRYAEASCRTAVIGSFRLPSTAQISGVEILDPVDAPPVDQQTLLVVGTVDFENKSGAMVTTGWTCQMRYNNGLVEAGPDVEFTGE